MLFKLGKQLKTFICTDSEDFYLKIISKFSSMINNYYQEIIIWIYTWLKLGMNEKIEQLLSNSIEKIILNPYPLVEKTIKDTG